MWIFPKRKKNVCLREGIGRGRGWGERAGEGEDEVEVQDTYLE